jgi:hypothetical protein
VGYAPVETFDLQGHLLRVCDLNRIPIRPRRRSGFDRLRNKTVEISQSPIAPSNWTEQPPTESMTAKQWR